MKLRNFAAVALLGAAGLVGCGQPEGPPMADVEGVVQFDSQPLTGATIRFHSDSAGSAAFPLDEAGHFQSRFPIRAGEYLVAVDYSTDKMPGGPLSGDLAKVPKHFWSLKDSGLTASVKTGSENTFAFDISSSAKAPPGFKPKSMPAPPPPLPPGIENK
ncbi:hypothetical protein [Blastopirellula marina]|uniref:Carboxypeptidase regulatory-like domain-containing protein n=1 Tax=Blastopirellula marina TaxID=124 RepID=A0A2S8GFM9_9BACT|nr:hypothetical protein [Blastopirellula marina]PQO43268.1 hypothetical protein C5Y93_26600 [Blastopirellula marina]